MRFEEFQTEIDWWGSEEDGFQSRVESQQAWKVSIEEIVTRNYNLDIRNPHVGNEVSHDPKELLSQYNDQKNQIQSLRNQLKTILEEALSGEN